jgi:hypothetical protein
MCSIWLATVRHGSPPWLYLRGVLFVLLTSSRPTFILGHAYPHGVWFYYPIVFALKSPIGFLVLLLLSLIIAVGGKRLMEEREPAIKEDQRFHWRAVWVALIVFFVFCVLGRMAISIRHFTVPIALLILLLAPLPRFLTRLRSSAPILGTIALSLTAVCALGCLFSAIHAYPFYFPYVNSLSLGRPAYTLLNDSNVDWNQALPEVKRFAEVNKIEHIKVDEYGFTEVTDSIPSAEFWDCQRATPDDAGSWVVVSGGSILDAHNCAWLQQFPMQPIGGGSMYALHLPSRIPAAGSPGGPPLPPAYRFLGGMPVDSRAYFLEALRDPDKLHQILAQMQARFQEARDAAKKSSTSPKDAK